MNNLLPLPVLLPLIAAALTLSLNRHPGAQRVVSTTAMIGVVGVAGVLMWISDRHGTVVLWIGDWPRPLGIALVADRLSALMLVVSSAVTLVVLVFAMAANEAERRRQTPISIFHPTLMVMSAGVSNAFLAGDLFNLFVGFELLLFASYVLLTLGGSRERVRAGSTYIVVSLLSSTLFLIAIVAVYAATGTVNLAQLALRLPGLPTDVQLIVQMLLLTVFGIKAAIFPMSAWLPDSYPTAPAPVTAVFAGLLTKVGVYAIIRTQTVLFPDSHLTRLLLWAALASMVVGICGAIAQSEIKRLLSFTLVSHIGYMIFGIGLASGAGYAGAIFYVVHHITIQTVLFLVIGLVEIRGGSTSLNRLGGLAAAAPVLGVLFFVPAMNLAGIPPLSGFVGKLSLLEAGAQAGGFLAYLLIGGSVVTSLLTLYALAKVWNRAFWRPRSEEVDPLEAVLGEDTAGELAEDEVAAERAAEDLAAEDQWARDQGARPATTGVSAKPVARRDVESGANHDEGEEGDEDEDVDDESAGVGRPLPRPLVATTAVLVALSVVLTVVAGPLYGYTTRAAADITGGQNYVDAVLAGPNR
ncbi:MAG: Na+/H+ antiporter subunit D [Propionibacteriaceae bacterium]